MIIWTIKLLANVRRAIAGRRYPSHLAWAVAFGLLLGIVPHGNVLAALLLLVVLTINLNHAMAALTAIGASFGAAYLDPYTDRIGRELLSNAELSDLAARAWALPIVPWTDLNNTIVLGSFVLGIAALIPVFLITYPLFKLLAWIVPAKEEDDDLAPVPVQVVAPGPEGDTESEIRRTHSAHAHVGPSKRRDRSSSDRHQRASASEAASASDANASPRPGAQPDARRVVGESRRTGEQGRLDEGSANAASGVSGAAGGQASDDSGAAAGPDGTASENTAGSRRAVETRIDVIRAEESQRSSGAQDGKGKRGGDAIENKPMDEALSHLLRQLRDSQQRKAA